MTTEDLNDEWLYVVRVSVDPNVEDEWNDWYDNEHLPAILACPGFIRATRYMSQSETDAGYMTVYAITDSTALETPEFASAKGWYQFADAVDFTTGVWKVTAASSR
jgi:hypothetical protein